MTLLVSSHLSPQNMRYPLINHPVIFLVVNTVSCLIQYDIFLSHYKISKTAQSSGATKINETESLPSTNFQFGGTDKHMPKK